MPIVPGLPALVGKPRRLVLWDTKSGDSGLLHSLLLHKNSKERNNAEQESSIGCQTIPTQMSAVPLNLASAGFGSLRHVEIVSLFIGVLGSGVNRVWHPKHSTLLRIVNRMDKN